MRRHRVRERGVQQLSVRTDSLISWSLGWVYTTWVTNLADAAGVAIPLAQCLGRIACFLQGCCFGVPGEPRFAVAYPLSDPVGFSLGYRPLHPVQLYESALDMGLCASLYVLFRRRPPAGYVYAWYLVGYGIIRFVTQQFRGDPCLSILGWPAPSALSAIAICTGSLWLAVGAVRRGVRKTSGDTHDKSQGGC